MDIRRPPKWKRVVRRVASTMVIAATVLGVAGFAIQRWRDSQVPSPTGAFVDIGGRRIHYTLSGTGSFSFVLEAGLGDYSASWRGLDSSLAELGSVFAYDRAGLGWSDSSPKAGSAEHIVDDLHRSLQLARVPKPYILVGHSFGGLTQMLYAMRHPDEICGLVLIDPSHPRQLEVLPKPPAFSTFATIQLAKLAPLGLPQWLMRGSDRVAMQAKHVRAAGAEFANLMVHLTSSKGEINLHGIPVYVLTSGALPPTVGESEDERMRVQQALFVLHEDILAASTSPIRRHEIVAGSTHYIHYIHRDDVVGFVRELIARIEESGKTAPDQTEPLKAEERQPPTASPASAIQKP
jgi:pimeloyl-ACP methyl ester carboxylesterase